MIFLIGLIWIVSGDDIDSQSPFECSSYLCPSYLKENNECDLNCMSRACNYDSSDIISANYYSRFLTSGCLSVCLNTNCTLNQLKNNICDSDCNNKECGFDLGYCGYCASGCYQNYSNPSQNMLEDNKPSPSCNHSLCMYDNNKYGWCAPKCFKESLTGSELNENCNNADCNYQDMKIQTSFCAPGCSPKMQSNGFCDSECDNEDCDYDNWDCTCSEACSDSLLYDSACHSECDNSDCEYQLGICGYCASGCFESDLGNQVCDDQCNNAGCDYDYGDCSCAPGCDNYYEFDTGVWSNSPTDPCDPNCLVEDCLFNYQICTNSFEIRAALFYSVYKDDPGDIFNISDCTENSYCTEQLLSDSDTNSVKNENCTSVECLYSMGLKFTSGNCMRAIEGADNLCFLCDSDSIQVYTSCLHLDDCPSGFKNYSELYSIFGTSVCLREPGYNLGNYYTITVNNDSDNEALVTAFQNATRKYNKILIYPGNYTINKLKSVSPIYNEPDSPLYTSLDLHIKEIVIEGSDKSNRPTIFFTQDSGTMKFYTLADKLVFRYVNFDASLSQKNGCNSDYCKYCPYYVQKYTNIYVNDRSQTIDPSNYGDNCESFNQIYFIQIDEGKELEMEYVDVNYFQQQFMAFIYSEGKVTLNNVNFDKIQASEQGAFIYIKNSGASFSYDSGTVSNLNYGYEFRSDIFQPGFLNAFECGDISINDVTFIYNFVMVGIDETTSSSLIQFKNIKGTASITNSEIKDSLIYNLITYDSTYVSYNSLSSDKYGYINEYHETHLLLDNLTLEYLVILNSVISVSMESIVQNIEISNSQYSNVFISGSSFISIINSGTYGDTEKEGVWGYFTEKNELELGFYDSRTVKFKNLTFDSISYSSYIIQVFNYPNLEIEDILISDCSQSSVESLIDYIIDSNLAATTYLTQTIDSNSVAIELCSHVLYFDDLDKIEIEGLTISNNTCTGGNTLLIEEVSKVSLTSVYINNMQVESDNQVILIDAVDELVVYNLTLSNLMREKSIVELDSITSINLTLITANNLNSTYLANFYIDKVSELSVSEFYCKICDSFRGNGGGISIIPTTSPASLIINSFTCIKCSANEGFGAGLYIDSYTVNAKHMITFNDLTFTDCSANDGTILTITSRLSLFDMSTISNVKVTNCKSFSGSIILDGHQKGILTISNYYSSYADAFYTFLNGLYSSESETLNLSNIQITDSYTKKSVISLTSTNQAASAVLTDITILNNYLSNVEALALQVDTMTVSITTFNINSGSGILAKSGSILYLSYLDFKNVTGFGISLLTDTFFTCDYCEFSNYIDGIVLSIEDNSNFTIRNSKFSNIHAERSSIALVVLCNDTDSYFYDCEFSEISPTKTQSYSIDLLWGRFNIYNSRFLYYEHDYDSKLFRCLECYLYLDNCTFNNLNLKSISFLDSTSNGQISITGSRFYNGYVSQVGFIYLITSELTISNSIFENCYNGDTTSGVFQIIAESSLYMNNVEFILNDSDNAGMSVYFTGNVLNITYSNFLIDTSSKYKVIYLGYGASFYLTNSDLIGSQCTGIKSDYQDNIYIYNSSFYNLAPALELLAWKKSGQYSLINSKFQNNGNLNINGGGLLLTSAKIKISNCLFANNSAENGAGIYFTSTLSSNVFDISNSKFISNSANVTGGALYWTDFEPNINNCEFSNNSAGYGSDIAAIPKKISFSSPESRFLSDIIDCVPGNQCTDLIITIYLLDTEGLVYNANMANMVQLSTNDLGYSISGTTRITSYDGIFSFANLTFSGSPGTNFTLVFTTSSIDDSASIRQSRDPDDAEISLTVSLRSCIKGEQETSTTCTTCSSGSYLIEPSNSCNNCKSGAKCLGGAKLVPEYGYWKSSKYSEVIYKCPLEQACLGYDESTDGEDYSGSCADGYTGKKCFVCKDGYTKAGANKCGKCPSKASNGIILFFLIVCSILFGGILVRSTLKSAYSTKSLYSIYIKIFTNYVQLVFLMTQFKLEWPSYVIEFFQIQSSIATAYDQVYSFNCIFLDSGFSNEDIYYYKLIFNSLVPLIVWALSLLFFIILSHVKKNNKLLREDFYLSMTVLFFLVYPSNVRISFSAFSCTYIDGDGYWLTENLVVQCWDSTHLKYALSVALPSIIIWCLGVPILVLLTMIKRRNYLNRHFNKVVFGFLYNGYKLSKFYWEFLIMLRKILIICIAVFMNSLSEEIQALTLVLILLISLYLQYEYKPYTKRQLNHMEFEAILTASITIYCGLYYLTNNINEGFKTVLFIMIILGNLYFIVYWAYYMVQATLDILSESIPAVKKITGKLDPYPEIVSDEPYVRQGVIQDDEDEELKFTIFPKYPKKIESLAMPGIKSMDDILAKVVERQIDAEERRRERRDVSEDESDGENEDKSKRKKFNTVKNLDD